MTDNCVQVEDSLGPSVSMGDALFDINDIVKGEPQMQGFFSRYSWIVFPLFIFWLFGIVLGIYGSKVYFKHKLDDAVKMNRIMIETVVYDLMPYDRTGK